MKVITGQADKSFIGQERPAGGQSNIRRCPMCWKINDLYVSNDGRGLMVRPGIECGMEIFQVVQISKDRETILATFMWEKLAITRLTQEMQR